MGEQCFTDRQLRELFADAADFLARPMACCGFTLYTYAIDGLTSGGDISEYVFKPISDNLRGESMEALFQAALAGQIYNASVSLCSDLNVAAKKLVNGHCVVLFPNVGAIAFETKTGMRRSPSAPEVENTVKGPKDAFVETMRVNTSLIRRHLRTPGLRLYQTAVGRRTLTNVTVVWIDDITNPVLVERMRERLAQIDIDGMLSPSAVEEYVTGSRATAFPLLQYTERADRFCQGLLDGRVGLLVDGLPLAYLAPTDMGYLMESPEDRSRDYLSASCIRLLRYGALLLSLLLPGIYIAMVTHHSGWIPEGLWQVICRSRENVPFHTATEALSLLLAYELLQESGIHLPQAVGQAVSTIGGIIVGTAAVDAGLISPVVLVVVSIAGVCGFVLPNRDLAQAVRLWRFALGIAGGIGGLLGIVVGLMLLLVHLGHLTSMGVPYLRIRRGRGRGILRLRLYRQNTRDPALNPRDMSNQKINRKKVKKGVDKRGKEW